MLKTLGLPEPPPTPEETRLDECTSTKSTPTPTNQYWTNLKKSLGKIPSLPEQEPDTQLTTLTLFGDIIPKFSEVYGLIEKYQWTLDDTYVPGKGGGWHNNVNIYTNSQLPDKKIAERSMLLGEATYDSEKNVFILENNKKLDLDLHALNLQELILTKYNCIKADEYKLSPELLFCGLCINDNINSEQLFFVIISEAYDSDLLDYYYLDDGDIKEDFAEATLEHRRDTPEQNKINECIRKQLTELLNKIGAALNTVCFDIKPQNCVIKWKNSEENPTVKLIDWDGDYCRLIPNKFRSDITDIGTLNNIIMANHFYVSIGINIFSKYFNEKNKSKELNYEKLKVLFCKFVIVNFGEGEPTETEMEAQHEEDVTKVDMRSFIHRANFYFTGFNFDADHRWDGTCETLFDIMYKRCFVTLRPEWALYWDSKADDIGDEGEDKDKTPPQFWRRPPGRRAAQPAAALIGGAKQTKKKNKKSKNKKTKKAKTKKAKTKKAKTKKAKTTKKQKQNYHTLIFPKFIN